MNNLRATALAREENQQDLSSGNYKENAGGSKRLRDDNEQLENTEKKPRVVWTKDMHQRFLDAVAHLGEDKAFPKKIVELMNVPGLTRANVASHLQKHRTCVKRAQEAFTGSVSYDNFGFNTMQETLQQAHWNPFQMGSRITNFNYNDYKSRSRFMPQGLSLLNTIRLKPDFHNYSVYDDERKNILLTSVEDSRMHPNTSFAGFRFAHDGKSLVFGQNNHLPDLDSAYIYSPLQQSLAAPQGIEGESVSMTSQLSSLAALLAVDEPMTQLQSSTALPRFDWDEQLKFTCEQLAVKTAPQSEGLQITDGAEPLSISSQQSSQGIVGESVSLSSQLSSILAGDEPIPATMTQLQPSAGSLAFDWDEPLKFTCEQQQLAVMTPPQSAGLDFTGGAEPPVISSQQPPSTNANADIFSDFTWSLPPELGELGAVGDHTGVDATATLFYDDLRFDG